YLQANADLIEKWKPRLTAPPGHLRVGLVWAGNPQFKGDRDRSMELSNLAQLARVPGVTFISLQKGTPAQQAKRPPEGMHLVNLSSDLADFADTAAVISQLDLVI